MKKFPWNYNQTRPYSRHKYTCCLLVCRRSTRCQVLLHLTANAMRSAGKQEAWWHQFWARERQQEWTPVGRSARFAAPVGRRDDAKCSALQTNDGQYANWFGQANQCIIVISINFKETWFPYLPFGIKIMDSCTQIMNILWGMPTKIIEGKK